MGKQHKFKFWDTFNKIWLDNTILNIDCNGAVRHFASPGSIGGVEVVQYTGLKDKNDMDIYEGHILSIKLPLGGFWGNITQEKIGIVLYDEDMGGYIVQWEYSRNQHHESLTCDIAFDSVILGNSFENDENDLILLRDIIN